VKLLRDCWVALLVACLLVAGDVRVHYFGACSLSFGDGVALANGDVMQVRFEGFGRPLRNPLFVDASTNAPVSVRPLG